MSSFMCCHLQQWCQNTPSFPTILKAHTFHSIDWLQARTLQFWLLVSLWSLWLDLASKQCENLSILKIKMCRDFCLPYLEIFLRCIIFISRSLPQLHEGCRFLVMNAMSWGERHIASWYHRDKICLFQRFPYPRR